MALLLVGRAAWGVARFGLPWRRAVPDGYELGLAGVACWVAGGPFDALWHEVFGFEADVEALMSPAHAILALGFGLMASGPLRAALRRPRARDLTMMLSLAFVVAILTFFTQIAHPVANLWAAASGVSGMGMTELGIVGILLTSAILSAPLLFLVGHGRMPAWGATVLIGLNAFAMGFLFDRGPYPRGVVVAIVVSAAMVDVVRAVLRPAASRAYAFRVFAVLLAAVPVTGYFIALAVMDRITWSTHLWVGTVVFAGAVGGLLSYLVLPPRVE
jgi:hypothetical protein